MRISKDNNKVVDLSKVQFAELMWVTHALGVWYKRKNKPTQPTVNGAIFDCDAIRVPSYTTFSSIEAIFKDETMLEYATRRGIVDYWNPELILQLTSNHSLVYTGQKALDLWKAWNAHIFGKRKKK